MVNFRLDDLQALLDPLRREGGEVQDKDGESAFGKFGWVTDPEGHKVELWQSPQGQ